MEICVKRLLEKAVRIDYARKAFAALLVMLCAQWVPACAKDHYGVQLYTVRAEMEQDFEGTLRRVAEIGYDEVEFAGLFGNDPVQVRKMLKRLRLKAVASHANWQKLRDDPDAVIAETRALGAKYIVLAWLPPEERQTIQQWRGWVGHMNRFAGKAKSAGLRFAYHAHDFEYSPVGGVRPIDVLTAELDPKFVQFEIDVFWTLKGGVDPVALLDLYPGRFALAHLKDMRADDGNMADLGDGQIDFAAFLAKGKQAGLRHAFAERDDAAQPFVTLERSIDYLKNIKRREKK